MFDVELNICIIFARALQQCSQKSSPSSDVSYTSQRHAGHSYKNSSILREDVSSGCWPNDCSRSGALQCTTRYADRFLLTPPGNSSGIAKSRLRDRRDSFILSCLQGQHDNAATSACRSASTFPGLLSNVCSCALCAGSAAAPPVPPMPPIPHTHATELSVDRPGLLAK